MTIIDRPATRDLPRITLSIIAILVLITSAGWIVAPFVTATVWATMIVIATWPLLLGLQHRLGGRRAPAVAVMVLLMVVLVVAPIGFGVSAIAGNVDRVTELARTIAEEGLPPPPVWVEQVPFVGTPLAERWRGAAGDPALIAARLTPYVRDLMQWVGAKAGGLASAVVHLVLTVLIAGILYASGEKAALGVRRFLRRLAGEQGENVAQLAAKSVRAVALGIVVTALLQTLLAGVGLFAVQVPQAGVLTAVTLVLCIAQLGPLLVMAPAVIWLYAGGSPGRGTVLLVFALVAMTLDNVIRPVLIKKGADLPLLLIMAGVIGGLITFGIVGLFVGPVVLAVTWTLVSSWVAQLDDAGNGTAAPGG